MSTPFFLPTKFMTVKQVREFLSHKMVFREALKRVPGLVIEPKDTVPEFGILVVEDDDLRVKT